MSRWIYFILCFIVGSSCGYQSDIVRNNEGNKYKIRNYNNLEKHEKNFDRMVFKHWYHKQYYPSTNSLKIINDTAVISDSITFKLCKHYDADTSFFLLFTRGIISGNVFDSIAGNHYSQEMISLTKGELDTVKAKKLYSFKVHSFNTIQFSKTDIHHLRIKFKAQAHGNPTHYYLELENTSANKDKCTPAFFISNSKLSFFIKSHTEI